MEIQRLDRGRKIWMSARCFLGFGQYFRHFTRIQPPKILWFSDFRPNFQQNTQYSQLIRQRVYSEFFHALAAQKLLL